MISGWLGQLFSGTGLLEPVGPDPELYVLYVLGLATVGLLWVRGDWRHRVISGLLAVFWARIALGAYLGAPAGGREPWVPDGVEMLAIGEALLLLLEGALRGTLRFAGRRGPWPLLGGAMLFYALAIHPLLGAVAPGRRFGAFFFGMPIPPLVFTLGMLLFLKDVHSGRRVLAIPLLWAAMGGSAPLLGTVHLWALRVVFVGGCAFAVFPEAIWKDRWQVDRRVFYEFALLHQERLNAFLVALLTGSLGYLFLWVNGRPLEEWFVRLITSLGLLGICALVYWLVFPAWLAPWFRSLAWAVARGAGTLWKIFSSALRWVALLVIAVLGIDAVGHRVTGKSTPLVPPQLTQPRQAQLVAGMLLLWLIYLAYLGRKRLVIQPFVDYRGKGEAGKDDGKEATKDGGTLLAGSVDSDLRNTLVSISDLYRVIDEALPVVRKNVIDVAADVKDVGDILKEAAGSGSVLKVLGTEIPANFIFSLLGRLVRGPRLTGSVNGTGKDVFLVAELSGGGQHGNWRVDCTHLEKEDRHLSGEPAIRKLTEQLAYRIATSLVSVGSPRWRAVRCFTEGLRHYRETQRTNKDCNCHLRLAERYMIEAANDDAQFAPCHFNLGVVYRRLGELGSARSTFRSAIRVDPGYYEACYALAETHLDEREFEEALWVCDSAIGINPGDARAWDLRAYAFRQNEQVYREIKFALPPIDPAWEEILSYCQIGTALSWRQLCRAALSGRASNLKGQRDSAVRCTSDLAVVLGRMKNFSKSEQIFRQAVQLARHDPPTQISFGKALYWSGRWDEACEVLTEVFEDGLDLSDRVTLWAILTRVRADKVAKTVPNPSSQDYEPARQAFQRLLDVMASLQEGEGLEDLLYVLEDMKDHAAAPAQGPDWISLSISLCKFLRVLGCERDEEVLKPLGQFKKALAGKETPVDIDFGWLKSLRARARRDFHRRSLQGPGMLPELLQGSIEDAAQCCWQWVHCQIMLKEARLLLGSKALHSNYKTTKRSIRLLESAIHKLETMGSIQPRAEGLFGLLAKAHRRLAESSEIKGEEHKLREYGEALAYSEIANELNPERAEERLTLVEAYSNFGDYNQAKEEATIALSFGNDSDALKRVGGSFWQRANAASTRGKRREVLGEAVQFFSDALKAVESEAFDKDHPLEQMESRAWAHHWLGRFHCELMEYEKGISHEEVAKSMGFKPMESRVNLANAYLEMGSYAKAEAAFREAREAENRLAPGHAMTEVLAAPGEERPLGELLIELHIGSALLNAEKGLTPESLSRLAHDTEKHVEKIITGMKAADQTLLQAALHEGIARLHLRAGQASESLDRAKRSLLCGFRSGAYLCLASALLMGEAPSPAEVRQAQEALRHAQDLDLRGLYHREARELRLRLQQLAGATPRAAVAPPPAAPPHPAV
jgi:tetratricopeptide (TPR) repeat protein